jgi:hypothetical protein
VYKDGSLEINQADESDTGFYKCIAKYRSLEFDSRQAYIKVNPAATSTLKPTSSSKPDSSLLGKLPTPKFLIRPEDQSVAEDNEIVLECLALNDASLFSTSFNNTGAATSESFSQPQYYKYKWLKDGVALDLTKNKQRYQLVQGVNLRLPRAQEADSGTYTCRICNSDDDDDSSTYNNNYSPQVANRNNDLSSVEMPMSDDCDERSAVVRVLGKLTQFELLFFIHLKHL